MKFKKFSGAASAALMIVIIVTLVLAPCALAQTKYKTVHKFKGAKDGITPDASLIFDQAGNLYSTTINGGSGYGTVFELTPNADGNWTETVLYKFGGSDGQGPMAGLVFDAAGNLYGTTYFGGDARSGTIFALTPHPNGNWTESVLHSFKYSDGANPVSGVILDAAGSLYGTTTNGGTYGRGTVIRLTRNQDGSWTESVLHSFKGGKDGRYPTAHGSLVFDSAGNLYGATAAGGRGNCNVWGPGCGTIFELVPNSDGTWTEQVLHRFSGGIDGATPDPTLTFDKSGNLYGTTMLGGAHGGGNVFELMPNADGSWKEKVLHQFKGGSTGPWAGVIFDQAGNLYGTTLAGGNLKLCGQGCGVVFKLAPNSKGGWTETVLHTFADHPGAYPEADMIFDTEGNLYGTTYGDSSKTFGSVFEITP